MKVVIRAGGGGTRLWPVSRVNQPKQFHALTSDKSLLREAVERVFPVVPIEDIFVSVNAVAKKMVQEEFPEVIPENIIIEPERKDTAAAIGLESIIIQKRFPDAVVASLGSDHRVRRVAEFQRMLLLAEEMARRHAEYILALGIRPTRPDTGYGYIECGEVMDTLEGKNLWHVDRFMEKPDLGEAKQFLEKANYLWNANMFVWRVETILQLYQKYLPQMYEQLLVMQQAVGTANEEKVFAEIYPRLERIAVDYAIIEKTKKVMAMSADIGWSDVGDWARLKDELAESEADNVVVGADHRQIETANTLIYSKVKGKMVATIGVDNLVIVDTPDVLLVCDKYHSSDVKEMVRKLKEAHKNDVL